MTTILIPTDDKESVASHFGRAIGYLKIKLEKGNIQKQFFTNRFTHHHNKHVHSHSHKDLIDNFKDCDVVIAAGMGKKLYDEFKSANKQIFFSDKSLIDDILNDYLKGTLSDNHDHFCQH